MYNIANHKAENKMQVEEIKTLWPEGCGFELERPSIGKRYIIIHLLTEAYVSEGDRILRAPSGSVICYPEDSYQYIAAKEKGLVHDWIHILGDLGSTADKYSFVMGRIYHPEDDSFVTEIMQEIEREFMRKESFCKELCEMKINELLLKLVRSESPSAIPHSTVRSALYDARARIHMDYSQKWTVEDMASLMHLSPSRFFSVYKSVFGISPMEDLIIARMEHARIFLTSGDFSVSQVAEMTGYQNVCHFIRACKKYFGVTPGKYMKK